MFVERTDLHITLVVSFPPSCLVGSRVTSGASIAEALFEQIEIKCVNLILVHTEFVVLFGVQET